jgi:hypothetical protein
MTLDINSDPVIFRDAMRNLGEGGTVGFDFGNLGAVEFVKRGSGVCYKINGVKKECGETGSMLKEACDTVGIGAAANICVDGRIIAAFPEVMGSRKSAVKMGKSIRAGARSVKLRVKNDEPILQASEYNEQCGPAAQVVQHTLYQFQNGLIAGANGLEQGKNALSVIRGLAANGQIRNDCFAKGPMLYKGGRASCVLGIAVPKDGNIGSTVVTCGDDPTAFFNERLDEFFDTERTFGPFIPVKDVSVESLDAPEARAPRTAYF